MILLRIKPPERIHPVTDQRNHLSKITKRLTELKTLLNRAAHAYYVLDDPQMEDAVYDRLYRELLELE